MFLYSSVLLPIFDYVLHEQSKTQLATLNVACLSFATAISFAEYADNIDYSNILLCKMYFSSVTALSKIALFRLFDTSGREA